jgi:hypothetical protein
LRTVTGSPSNEEATNFPGGIAGLPAHTIRD